MPYKNVHNHAADRAALGQDRVAMTRTGSIVGHS